MQNRFFTFILVLLFLSASQELYAMSDQQEINIGRQFSAEVERQYGLYHDPRWENKVETIGGELAQNAIRKIPYSFRVINMKDANAFALPGGFIYVTKGLLSYFENDDELAAVLAHEISHVELKHFQKMYARENTLSIFSVLADILTRGAARPYLNAASILNNLVFQPGYSREQESQADLSGVKLMVLAGIDPNAMISLFQAVQPMLKGFEVVLAFSAKVRNRHGRLLNHRTTTWHLAIQDAQGILLKAMASTISA